jgi:hypothetical protein
MNASEEPNNSAGNRPNGTRAPTGEAEELVRDWQLLFWGFLLFGLLRLAWMYMRRQPENWPFNLGVSCGFLFCGVLGFLMRYVLSPRMKKQ